MTSVALLGRGLAIVRAYARVRTLGDGTLLRDVPLFAKTIAGVAAMYRADMLLTYFVASLLGASEDRSSDAVAPPQDYTKAEPAWSGDKMRPASPETAAMLVRVLTPVVKARTAKHAIAGLQECMEALGGVGYLENEERQEINIARLLRDAHVLAIWEGTTDVVAAGAVKVLLRDRREPRSAVQALLSWLGPVLADSGQHSAVPTVKDKLRRDAENFVLTVTVHDPRALERDVRKVVQTLGDLVCGALLWADYERDGDAVAQAVCLKIVGDGDTLWAEDARNEMEHSIAFGVDKDVALGEERSKL